MNNKVSIIVPLYNMESLIGKCLESLISQVYNNIEIVVINDGSTDESGKIAESFAKKDNRVKVIHHNGNKGIACGFKTGITNSTGDYIVFVDSDNYVSNSFIQNLIDVKQFTKADIVQCNAYCYVDEAELNQMKSEERKIIELNNREEIITDFLLKKNITNNLSSKLFEKAWLEKVEIPEGRQVVDIIIMLQMVGMCHKYICINDYLYFAYMAPNSISRSNVTERRLSDLDFAIEYYNNYINNNWPKNSDYTYFQTAFFSLWAYNNISLSKYLKDKEIKREKYKKQFVDNYKNATDSIYYLNMPKIERIKWQSFYYLPFFYKIALKLREL